MRILLATSFPVPGEFDGTAMLPIKISRALKSRGVDVAFAHLRARPPWGPVLREEFEGSPSWTLPALRWIGGLEEIHSRFPFDLVHAQHHGGANRALFASKKHNWPMVYEIHSLLGDEYERSRLGRGLAFQLNVMLERQVCKYAGAVIVLGNEVARVFVEEKGVPPKKISVIYPGIDVGEFERVDRSIQIPSIGNEHEVVMYIGSIVHPNQGVPLLIDALPEVFVSRPLARCVLVGGPAAVGEEYRRRLGSFGDRLVVLTDSTPEQVVAYAARADVLVHPRLACRENYSVQSKIAVYLAAGRPIVATDFADYKTILGQTGAGLLCPPSFGPLADAIVRVLSDRGLANSLASATRPVALELFSMDRNIDRYLEVYKRVLEHRNGIHGMLRQDFPEERLVEAGV